MNRPRPMIKAADREAALAAAHGRCQHCGTAGVPLELGFIVPLSEGGTTDLSNLEAICVNCHVLMQRLPSEAHFVSFVTELMKESSRFSAIESDPAIGPDRLRPDIIAVETSPGGSKRKVLVECKSISVLSGPRVAESLRQLEKYKGAAPDIQAILAFPGKVAPEIVEELTRHAVEIWDIDRIGSLFSKEIQRTKDGYYSALFHRALVRKKPELQLIEDIKNCPFGLPGWSTYQKLIGRALEMLFCPPLNKPFSENADFEKVNRRDFIFPNYASEGFWLTLRQRYCADYVLVDAKNSKGKVSKAHVLQIANYLKPHGVGQFAIIIGRQGPDRLAQITIREQWLMHSKLIVVLEDRDMEAMLLATLAEGDPADILSDKIQQFRLLI